MYTISVTLLILALVNISLSKNVYDESTPEKFSKDITTRQDNAENLISIPNNDVDTKRENDGKYYCVENVALSKNTAQSTVASNGYSSRAVDGNTDSHYSRGSCTHTVPVTESPWWRVDLGKEYEVTDLMITNRGDCCSDRLNGFEIRIGNSLDDNGNYNPLCGGSRSLGNGETGKISCPSPMKGRYVNIRLPGIGKVLTLCEVQVFT